MYAKHIDHGTLRNVPIIIFLTDKRNSYHELNRGKFHPSALASSPSLLVSARTVQLPLSLVGPSVRQDLPHHYNTLPNSSTKLNDYLRVEMI